VALAGTIVALASPETGERAVVRVSGSACAPALAALTGEDISDAPRGCRRTALDIGVGAPLPALLVWMPAPRSYTGEDCAEVLRDARFASSPSESTVEKHATRTQVPDAHREALDALAGMCGDVTSDDILGHVFSRFCIGK